MFDRNQYWCIIIKYFFPSSSWEERLSLLHIQKKTLTLITWVPFCVNDYHIFPKCDNHDIQKTPPKFTIEFIWVSLMEWFLLLFSWSGNWQKAFTNDYSCIITVNTVEINSFNSIVVPNAFWKSFIFETYSEGKVLLLLWFLCWILP